MIYFPTLNIMFNHFLSNPSCIQSLTKTTYPTPPPSAIPAWCSDACPRRHVQWPTSSSKHCVSPVATKGTPSLYLFLISNRIKSEIPMRVEIDTWEQHHIDVHWNEDCQDHVKKGHWFCVPIETGVSTADKNMQKFCQCWNLDFKTMHTTAKESQVHLHNFFKRQRKDGNGNGWTRQWALLGNWIQNQFRPEPFVLRPILRSFRSSCILLIYLICFLFHICSMFH